MMDIHIHTNYSDGQYSPNDIIKLANKNGVSILSITDHDTVSGIDFGKKIAKEISITFIPGIEISVTGNKELHILGYYVDDKNNSLIDLCNKALQSREHMKKRIFEYLKSQNIELEEGNIMKQTAGRMIGRPHFALALLEAGYVSSFQDAFEKYLSSPELLTVDRAKPSPYDAIQVILNANGVPVLAHPALLGLDNYALDMIVSELKNYGLAGIECFYSTHTPEQVAFYLKLAKKYKLLVTCGSDFHGEKISPNKSLGGCGQDLSISEIQEIYNCLRSAQEDPSYSFYSYRC